MSGGRINRRMLLRSAALLTPLAIATPTVSARTSTFKRLDPNSPVARSLLYVEDTREVPKDHPLASRHSPEQKCLNCAQLRGEAGETWRPCPAFAGRLVNVGGWCTIWQGR
ncbi:MAG: high-potential iron-sulfur protein [Chromatiales bacterium]|nr:high-potential iron-sulfur protein [Chromatiales bacterium]